MPTKFGRSQSPASSAVIAVGHVLPEPERALLPSDKGCGRIHYVLSDLSPEDLQRRANELFWFHRVDLARGVITPGVADFTYRADQLPPVAGRSVLDIGAWDGGYSYLAERQGAARVVALDHYAWDVDFGARGAYWRQCAEEGVLPDHDRDTTDFWDTDLPGQRAFNFAHEALNSTVEPILDDFSTMDLDRLGTFDVVFYLGVLYHMREPLTSLERVRRVTGEVAAIETVGLNVPGRNHERLLQFHGGDELGADYGNWYIPTAEALQSLCLAAGFRKVDVVLGPPEPPTPSPGDHVGQGATEPPSVCIAPSSTPTSDAKELGDDLR